MSAEISVTKSELEAVKRHLRLTYDDPDIDRTVTELIEDATIQLNHKLGAELNYFSPSAERRLFLSYISYLWNECEEEFDGAYSRQINEIRRKVAVENEKQEKV